MDDKKQAAAVLAGIVLAVSLTIAVRYEPYTFIRRDASFYATIARGLVMHASLDQRKVQPQSWYSGQHPGYANLDMYWSDVSVGRNGTWYPKHSFLISAAAAPFYALFGVPGFLLFNALCVIGMLWSAYLLAVRFAPPAAAALAVLFIAACPTLLDHTYLLSADVFNATLIALGALALFSARPATAGALLGLAVWARPLTAVIAAPLAAAVFFSKGPSQGPLNPPRSSAAGQSPSALTRFRRTLDRRALLRFAIAAAVPLGAAAVANTIMYGAPWVTSYDRTLVVEGRAPAVASHRALFSNTLAAGFRLMFQDREHGLGANALPALVAVAGLVPLALRNLKLAAALAIALAGFVAGYIRYRYFNARFFFAWQVLLIVPLAVLIGDAGRWALAGGEAVRAAGPRVAASVRRLPRGLVWGALAALLVAGLVVRFATGRSYGLAQHVADAKVLRNDFPCDYFNMTHLAWECSRLDRSSNEYTGLAIQPNQCRFDGGHRRAILIAPPPDGGSRQMTFSPNRRGRLVFDYGVEQGSPVAELCLSVAYGGRPPERLCARGPGQLQQHVFAALQAGEPAQIDIAVTGHAPRSLCFDGTVEP